MVKIRHFCYLFEMHKVLSVTVQKGIPQAFCTDRIPCQTHQIVHDDIDITTRVSSEICTNKSAVLLCISLSVSLFGSLPPPPPVCPSPHTSLPHFFNRTLPLHQTFAHALAPPSTTVSAPLPRFTCPVSLSFLLSLCAPTISPSFCFCVSLSFSCVLHLRSSLLSIYLSL